MHQIIFHFPDSWPILGGANIYAYGLMLGLAFIIGWHLGLHYAAREGINPKTTTTTYMLVIIFALIGARVAHLISNPHTWRYTGFFASLFSARCEGLVAYGGFIGGTLAAWAYLKIKSENFWSLCDCTAPSMVLGLGFTRIGCFLAGCCHGQPTDLPWGVVFPLGSQAAGVYPSETGGSLAVHPTQLYESMVGFALFPLSVWLLKRRRFTGQSFLIIMACYALARFLLELIRGDTDRGTVIGPISTSQFIGLVLIPLAATLYVQRRRSAPPPPDPLDRDEIRRRITGAKKTRDVSSKSQPKKKKNQK